MPCMNCTAIYKQICLDDPSLLLVLLNLDGALGGAGGGGGGAGHGLQSNAGGNRGVLWRMRIRR